jgi:5-methylcytosine-specific restriction endonuclease McrA
VWLLETFDRDLGPDKARCWLDLSPNCLRELDEHSVTADRINPGGSYRHENIQPACAPCQNHQGALITAEKRHQWLRWMDEARAAGIEWDGQVA